MPAAAADSWVVPSDAALAARDPDRFAWAMFVALTWPADPASRMPATDRPYGDPGPVMFETWALTGQVFPSKGAEPPAWEDIDWSAARTVNTDSLPREISLFRGAYPEASSAALAAQLIGKLTTPSQAAVKAELKIRIQEALNSMDAVDREVLTLRHFEQLSNAETAQVLDIKETTACNRYVRALERLRGILGATPGSTG